MATAVPAAALAVRASDAEGGVEMTESVGHIRDFCRIFSRRPASVRIFFPDVNEVASARQGTFSGTQFQLDYLTKVTGFEDIGFGKKLRMEDRVRDSDEVFIAAYPHFNVNEMLAVEDLWSTAARPAGKPIIIFNGELDRIHYPAFFYPKLGRLAKSFLPHLEAAYYLHNFKGSRGGKLFRAYPGPWQVLREARRGLDLVHSQDDMPSLKQVALEILPAAT
eukprot:SM000040S14853  [mRNA]  locus=s40:733852:735758:+ [translate_table: standard]